MGFRDKWDIYWDMNLVKYMPQNFTCTFHLPNSHTQIHTPPHTPHTDSYPDAIPIHDTSHKKPIHAPHGHRHRNKTMHASHSLNKLSSSSDNLSQGSVTLGMQGKSRSNLYLGRTRPSITSIIEEPRQSISTSSEPNIVIWSELWLAEGHVNSYFCTWRSTSVVTS